MNSQSNAKAPHITQIHMKQVKFEKDLMHTIGYTKIDPEKKQAISKLDREWVGIKTVFYNLSNGKEVKLEAENGFINLGMLQLRTPWEILSDPEVCNNKHGYSQYQHHNYYLDNYHHHQHPNPHIQVSHHIQLIP